ncbi:MAG: CRISPR-associated endonuclease Cas1 [Gloeomargarita sp. HHBFW_bins_162]
MRTLYVVQQGTVLTVTGEQLYLRRGEHRRLVGQLPLLDAVLLLGMVQVTTQAVRACLRHNIPLAYLSRSGWCHGRTWPVGWGERGCYEAQRQVSPAWQVRMAATMVRAKIRNCRTVLLRHYRRYSYGDGERVIDSLQWLAERVGQCQTLDQVRGMEGAAAAIYFPALGECVRGEGFIFLGRSRRPPTNPMNALLSFGYQVLWSHLLLLVELHGLDPRLGTLHTDHHGHCALVSDLIEEFRAPFIDSLVLSLINTKAIQAERDFEYRDGGCFLHEGGRRIFLQAWIRRMETKMGQGLRWDVLSQQVKRYRQAVLDSDYIYTPYQID